MSLLAYASRTGTRRNLDALRRRGWRLLVSAYGCHRSEGFPYAIDNGAWSAYARGEEWDERKFETLLRTHGAAADWSVLPDIVAGGPRSLERSLLWMRRVLDESPRALLAVQNGMTPADVRPFLGGRVGIFVGGDTRWKLETLPEWGALAEEIGCWLHVGRVNSARRIALCVSAGAHSFDGTSATRYAVELPKLDSARKQTGWRF